MRKSKNFDPGAFVWAKMKGYPPWPARIVGLKIGSRKFPVYFFGTFDTANIIPNEIFDYVHNKQTMATEKNLRRKNFRLAFEQLEAALAGNDVTPQQYLDKIQKAQDILQSSKKNASAKQNKKRPSSGNKLEAALEKAKELTSDNSAENSKSNIAETKELLMKKSPQESLDMDLKHIPTALENSVDLRCDDASFSPPAAGGENEAYESPVSDDEDIDFADIVGNDLHFAEVYEEDTDMSEKAAHDADIEMVDGMEENAEIGIGAALPLVFMDAMNIENQQQESDNSKNVFLLSKKFFTEKYWDKLVLVQISNAQHGIKLVHPQKPKDFLSNQLKRETWEKEAITYARDLRDKLELGVIDLNDPSLKDCLVKNAPKAEFFDFEYEANEQHLQTIAMLGQHEQKLKTLTNAIKSNLKYLDQWHRRPKQRLKLANLRKTVLQLFYMDEYFMSLLRQPETVWTLHDLYQYYINLEEIIGHGGEDGDDQIEIIKTYHTFQEIRSNAFDILLRWRDLLELDKFAKNNYVDDNKDFQGFPENLPFMDVFNRFVDHFQAKTRNLSADNVRNLRLSQLISLVSDFNG